MKVLVSGASIAGPVLAYWLNRYGFDVTVVEKAPELRKTGGHAVDLYGPAMEISERMGVGAAVKDLATGTDDMAVLRNDRPARHIDLRKIYEAGSDKHVEIMRDDLSGIYFDTARNDVEYVFSDSISEIAEDGEVAFDNGPTRKFDLVIGADGLHSNVRRLAFGPESDYSSFLGAYLAVQSVPRDFGEPGMYKVYTEAGLLTGVYGAEHLDDARAVFLFRTERPLDYQRKDIPLQKDFVRERFADRHPEVDRWLTELDGTPAFYFDSITQLSMETWSKGRVSLVGDAGYCPGPAVGGSTSLAVYGAYVLAGELAEAGGDHTKAYPAYERAMAEAVEKSRSFARGAAKSIIPGSRFGSWALVNGARLVTAMPGPIRRGLMKMNGASIRFFDSLPVKDYERR